MELQTLPHYTKFQTFQTWTLFISQNQASLFLNKKRGTLPVSIANYFRFRSDPQHGYNLRSQTRPREPQIVHRTASGKRSIHFRGSELWTEVPDEIKTARSPKSFKKLYKLHLLPSTEQSPSQRSFCIFNVFCFLHIDL